MFHAESSKGGSKGPLDLVFSLTLLILRHVDPSPETSLMNLKTAYRDSLQDTSTAYRKSWSSVKNVETIRQVDSPSTGRVRLITNPFYSVLSVDGHTRLHPLLVVGDVMCIAYCRRLAHRRSVTDDSVIAFPVELECEIALLMGSVFLRDSLVQSGS